MTPTEIARIVSAALRKEGIILVRYPVNFIGGVISTYILFIIIFLGGRTVGGSQFSSSLAGIVVGYFFVLLATISYQQVAITITREANWGTLEQLYLSPMGFSTVIVTSVIVRIFYNFIWTSIVLILIVITTGVNLEFPLFTVIVVCGLGLVSVLGIGFAVGGITVIFKRVSNLFNLLQFGFIGLVAAPILNIPVLRALPLVGASRLLQRAMQNGTRLWEFSATSLIVLITVAVVYFTAGYTVFVAATRIARRRGALGHY